MGFPGYDPGVVDGRLIQGEILGPLVEYVPQTPPVPVEDGAAIPVKAVTYQRVMLMTQDCDLEQDARLRLSNPPLLEPRADVTANHGSVPHLLLCPVFEDIRSVVAGGDVAKRAKRNQDERYHAFMQQTPDESVDVAPDALPLELFIDFRRYVSLPTEFVYAGLASGSVGRLAIVPEIFRLDVAHRFFGYQSRIPVP